MFWELYSGTYYLHGLPPGRMENDLVLRLTLNLLVLVEITHILLRGAAGYETISQCTHNWEWPQQQHRLSPDTAPRNQNVLLHRHSHCRSLQHLEGKGGQN